MVTNRRNHYRMLHVQTDAPPEVIKAAYRALITLHHPDAGGDHERAALINEAYTVLSNPARRSAYDTLRVIRWSRQSETDPRANAAGAAPEKPERGRGDCPMCGLHMPALQIMRDTRCTRCRAPMAPVRKTSDKLNAAERRGLPRVTKTDWAVLYPTFPSEVVDVRMRDLSLDGLSVYCGIALPVGRTIRVTGDAFDVVADIVSCRPHETVFTLHARLVTALFTNETGGFVSTTA